jgi:hypothetical protein
LFCSQLKITVGCQQRDRSQEIWVKRGSTRFTQVSGFTFKGGLGIKLCLSGFAVVDALIGE